MGRNRRPDRRRRVDDRLEPSTADTPPESAAGVVDPPAAPEPILPLPTEAPDLTWDEPPAPLDVSGPAIDIIHRAPVDGDNVHGVGYDPERAILAIEDADGHVYWHHHVGVGVDTLLLASDTPDQYVADHLNADRAEHAHDTGIHGDGPAARCENCGQYTPEVGIHPCPDTVTRFSTRTHPTGIYQRRGVEHHQILAPDLAQVAAATGPTTVDLTVTSNGITANGRIRLHDDEPATVDYWTETDSHGRPVAHTAINAQDTADEITAIVGSIRDGDAGFWTAAGAAADLPTVGPTDSIIRAPLSDHPEGWTSVGYDPARRRLDIGDRDGVTVYQNVSPRHATALIRRLQAGTQVTPSLQQFAQTRPAALVDTPASGTSRCGACGQFTSARAMHVCRPITHRSVDPRTPRTPVVGAGGNVQIATAPASGRYDIDVAGTVAGYHVTGGLQNPDGQPVGVGHPDGGLDVRDVTGARVDAPTRTAITQAVIDSHLTATHFNGTAYLTTDIDDGQLLTSIRPGDGGPQAPGTTRIVYRSGDGTTVRAEVRQLRARPPATGPDGAVLDADASQPAISAAQAAVAQAWRGAGTTADVMFPDRLTTTTPAAHPTVPRQRVAGSGDVQSVGYDADRNTLHVDTLSEGPLVIPNVAGNTDQGLLNAGPDERDYRVARFVAAGNALRAPHTIDADTDRIRCQRCGRYAYVYGCIDCPAGNDRPALSLGNGRRINSEDGTLTIHTSAAISQIRDHLDRHTNFDVAVAITDNDTVDRGTVRIERDYRGRPAITTSTLSDVNTELLGNLLTGRNLRDQVSDAAAQRADARASVSTELTSLATASHAAQQTARATTTATAVDYAVDYAAFDQLWEDVKGDRRRGLDVVAPDLATGTLGINRRFGHEIEFVGGNAEDIALALYDAGLTEVPFRMPYHAWGPDHYAIGERGYQRRLRSLQANNRALTERLGRQRFTTAQLEQWARNRDSSKFVYEYDQTVCDSDYGDGNHQSVGVGATGGEIVSPILSDTTADWQRMDQVLRIARDHGATVDRRVGGHVHLDVSDFDHGIEAHNNVVALWRGYADELWRLSTLPGSDTHRGTFYANPNLNIGPRFTNTGQVARHNHHRDAVNWSGVTRLGAGDHLEFRSFDGSLDLGVRQAHTRIAAGLVQAAFTARQSELQLPARPIGTARQANPSKAPLSGEGWQAQTRGLRELLTRIAPTPIAAKQIVGLFATTKWQNP